jgi:tyrosyl-tRNA synthetase
VERYLKMFTFLPLEEIASTMAEHARDRGKRIAQWRLGMDVTARVHGAEAAEQAMQTSRALFENVSASGRSSVKANAVVVPERRVPRAHLRALSLVELLVASGLATSKADARRGIQGKGFYLNDEPIEAVDRELDEAELQGPPEARFVILRKGKKNYVRLVLES